MKYLWLLKYGVGSSWTRIHKVWYLCTYINIMYALEDCTQLYVANITTVSGTTVQYCIVQIILCGNDNDARMWMWRDDGPVCCRFLTKILTLPLVAVINALLWSALFPAEASERVRGQRQLRPMAFFPGTSSSSWRAESRWRRRWRRQWRRGVAETD